MSKQPEIPRWLTIDKNGFHHFDIPLLMKEAGIPDTPHNREVTVEAAEKILKSMYPGVPLNTVRSIDN